MTANFVADEFKLIDSKGIDLAVTASQQLPSGTSGLMFAGLDEDNVVRYPNINSSGALAVRLETSNTSALTGVGLVRIFVDWTMMKSLLDQKQMALQFVEDATKIELFTVDLVVVYITVLYKGTVPDGGNQAANDAALAEFEFSFRDISNRPLNRVDRDRYLAVESNYRAEGIASSSYHMLIDLNNVSGSYPHMYTNGHGVFDKGVKMTGVHAVVVKNNAQDKWVAQLGVVLETSPTGSKVSWLRLGTQNVRDTGLFPSEIEMPFFPMVSDLTVTSSQGRTYLKKVANNNVVFESSLTSETPLLDPNGNTIFAERGDVILNAKRVAGSGDLLVHYHLWYFVD